MMRQCKKRSRALITDSSNGGLETDVRTFLPSEDPKLTAETDKGKRNKSEKTLAYFYSAARSPRLNLTYHAIPKSTLFCSATLLFLYKRARLVPSFTSVVFGTPYFETSTFESRNASENKSATKSANVQNIPAIYIPGWSCSFTIIDVATNKFLVSFPTLAKKEEK